MNRQLSASESFCESDLVFIMSGGPYTGKTLPIKTQKCILAFDSKLGSAQQSRCAIFRGDAGVTVRNLDSRVLVNGEVRHEHWLQTGDRIEFPNSIVLEVSQLGRTASAAAFHSQQPALADSATSETEFSSSEPDRSSYEFSFSDDSAESSLFDDHRYQDRSSLFDPASNSASPIDSEVSADVLSCVENRFHEIEDRLNQLAEQISSLVTLASCGKLSSAALPESDWQKQVNRSSVANPSPTTAIPENDPPVRPEKDTVVPTNRFNVAEFVPAAESSKPEQAVDETNQGDAHLASGTEISSVVAIDALVPNRRVPGQLNHLVSENEDASISKSTTPLKSSDVELSGLVVSLSEKEGASLQTPSRETQVEVARADGASKFSTLDAIKTAAPAATQSASGISVAPFAAGENVAKPASVDDEIDRLLSRLFEGKSFAPASPTGDAIQDQSPSGQNQGSDTAAEPIPESTQVKSSEADPIDLSAGSQAENSYANMRFGYELSANGSRPANVVPAAIVAASEEMPLAEAMSTNPVEALADDEEGGESMLDLLARLKQEGCWDHSESDSQDSRPCPMQEVAGAVENNTTQTVESFIKDPGETSTAQPAVAATDSVEDYMNQLLARMNLGMDSHVDSRSKEQISASNAKQAQAELDKANRSSELITAEEYVPKQKAAKIESLETMREIANTTARSAVAFSNLDRRKARGLMQTVIGIGALIMAAYYFLFVSKAFADTAFVVGSICLIISGGASYMAFQTFRGTGILRDLFPKSNGKE